jgi:cytochrome b561
LAASVCSTDHGGADRHGRGVSARAIRPQGAPLRHWNRWLALGAPPLPADLPRTQALAAKLSHVVLYALLIAMPLIGWGMLSAGDYPIVLYGSFHLPEYLPHNDELHAILRTTHTVLAYVFFATILLHVAAALFHALIRRDGVFRAMAGIGPRERVTLGRRT